MSNSPDKDDIANSIATACVNAREMLEPVEEAARGYKAWLMNQGWGQAAAEQMAVEYYKKVMKWLT